MLARKAIAQPNTTNPAAAAEAGARLSEARTRRGLSLDQAAQHTRISVPFLEALEAGDLAALPGPKYARDFTRSYAQYLGVPPADVRGLLGNGRRPASPHRSATSPEAAHDAAPGRRRRRPRRDSPSTGAKPAGAPAAGDGGEPPIEHPKDQAEPDRPGRLAFLGILTVLAGFAIAAGFFYGLDNDDSEEPLLVGGALTSPTSTSTLQPSATAADDREVTATPTSSGPRIRRTPTPYAIVAPEPVYEEPTIVAEPTFEPTPVPTEEYVPTEEPTPVPTEETPEPTVEPTQTEPPPPTETEPPPTEEPTEESGLEAEVQE